MIQSYYMILLLNTNYINTEIKYQANAPILRKKVKYFTENDAIISLNNNFKQKE